MLEEDFMLEAISRRGYGVCRSSSGFFDVVSEYRTRSDVKLTTEEKVYTSTFHLICCVPRLGVLCDERCSRGRVIQCIHPSKV